MRLVLITTLLIAYGCGSFQGRPLINELTNNRDSVTQLDITRTLAEKTTQINETYNGASALLYAMSNVNKKNKFSVVEMMLSKGADINFSGTWVPIDSVAGNISQTEFDLQKLYHPSLITDGPLVNHLIYYSYYSITDDELKSWQDLLLKYKFKVDQTDSKRSTPLLYAVEQSIKLDKLNAMIPFLVKNGADCNYKNVNGLSPVSLINEKANKELKNDFFKLCSNPK